MEILAVLSIPVWLWSVLVVAGWRVHALEKGGEPADILHDWATQLYARGTALILLVLLFAAAK